MPPSPVRQTYLYPTRCSGTAALHSRCTGSDKPPACPAVLERDIHERLRALLRKQPPPIHPAVLLAVDAGAPHRAISLRYRARHEQVPLRPRRITVHMDLAVQTVVDGEGEDAARSLEESPDRFAALEP